MANLTGKTLGKYQIIERLGRGGMAEVYKAYHPQLERYAAVKVLHSYLAEGQDFLARFQREAKAIAALRHPNIVQIYDIDIEDEHYYMVMEFIDGGTLKDRLIQAGGPLSIAEMAHIFRETASALDYAHRQGVLHRDIKPANVLLDKSGRVVLTDFGIARIVSETQFTVTGTLVGTPAYMSPEQGMGMPISTSSDIYSLGIILYEMVTGKVPFDADTPLAVIHKHINEPLPSPRELRDDIPRALERVIVKALSKGPQDRYQSAAEMRESAEAAFEDFTRITLSETMAEAPRRDVRPDLEAGLAQPEPTLASKATVAMPPEEEDIAAKATVAMEVEKAPPQPPAAKPTPVKKAPQKPKIKPLPILLGIAALALIAVLLIWGIPRLTGGGADCATLDECHILAEERRQMGDLEGAISAVDLAIGYVPDNERPINATLWCLKGELHTDLDQSDQAIASFEECIGWTGGSPEFEDTRNFAEEQISRLTAGIPGSSGGEADCASVEACHGLAEELLGIGDAEGAIRAIEKAIGFVAENEHPANAKLWCMRGEVAASIEHHDEAIRDFEECQAWTEGDPDLEELRVFARDQINMIQSK